MNRYKSYQPLVIKSASLSVVLLLLHLLSFLKETVPVNYAEKVNGLLE